MLNKLQFQNLAELQLQNLDQPLCSKSEKSLVLGPNVSSQICNKLLPTWSSASTSATVATSTSFELASSHAKVTSIKFTKQEWVSELVSQGVNQWQQWSNSGPIKRNNWVHLIKKIEMIQSTYFEQAKIIIGPIFSIFFMNKDAIWGDRVFLFDIVLICLQADSTRDHIKPRDFFTTMCSR